MGASNKGLLGFALVIVLILTVSVALLPLAKAVAVDGAKALHLDPVAQYLAS